MAYGLSSLLITALIDLMFWGTDLCSSSQKPSDLSLACLMLVCFSSVWSVTTVTYCIYLYKGWRHVKSKDVTTSAALKRPLRPPPPMPPRKWSSSHSSEVGDPNLTEGRNSRTVQSCWGCFSTWTEFEVKRMGFRPVALFMNYICMNQFATRFVTLLTWYLCRQLKLNDLV